ncbi:MAG: SagB family peptide dehydrogenase [Chloroflexota bacterium]
MINKHIAWAPHTTLNELDENRIQIRSPRRQLVTESLSSGQRAAFDLLAGMGVPSATLMKSIEHEDVQARMRLVTYQHECIRLGLIEQVLVVDERPIAGAISIADSYWPRDEKVPARPALSRFALLRPHEEHFVLESPLSLVQVHLYEPQCLAWLGTLLSDPSASNNPTLDKPSEQENAMLQLLTNASLLTERLADGRTQEEVDDTLQQWQFHDLYFHSRSRDGRTPEAVGGTYRFRESIAPLPLLKPPMSDSIVTLPRPDLKRLATEDASFTSVLEGRRSQRKRRHEPPTLAQLSEFLFRSARVQQKDEKGGVSWRPYPSGGACHELEIYVAVDECTGLKPDLYHYEPDGHQLGRLMVDSDALRRILIRAASAQAVTEKPNLLLLITARFQRVSWKYSALAYALTLKNVGGLMQTMYLVATAMELAPCAIGTGDSDLFARLTDIDVLQEGLVGEFTLR